MATSNQDTNIKDVAAPASATTTNIGHVLGLNAAKTQDVLIPLSMLRTVIAAELKTALAAITSGSPDVPVLDGNNLKYMTLANFAKVVGGQYKALTASDDIHDLEPGILYRASGVSPIGSPQGAYNYGIYLVLDVGSGKVFFYFPTGTREIYKTGQWSGQAGFTSWAKVEPASTTPAVSAT